MEQQPGSPFSSEEVDPPSRRRTAKIALAVGVTALLGMAGTGIAYAVGGSPAQTSSGDGASLSASSGSTTTTVPGEPGRKFHRGFGGPGFGFGFGFGPGMGGAGPVVHGQFTEGSGSTYKTIAFQNGTVKSVSASAITVASRDGFSQSYVVQSSTVVDAQSNGIATVAKGDTVIIEGLVQGSKITATNIADTTKIGSSRQGFGFGSGFGPGDKPMGPGAAPGAASSAA